MPVDQQAGGVDPLEAAFQATDRANRGRALPVPPPGYRPPQGPSGGLGVGVSSTPASTPRPSPPRPTGLAAVGAAITDTASRAANYLTRGGPGEVANRVGRDLENSRNAIGAGFIRFPGQLVGGGLDTYADAGRFIGETILPQFIRDTRQRAQVATAMTALAASNPITAPMAAGAILSPRSRGTSSVGLADILSMRSTLGQIGNPGLNQGATVTIATAFPMLFGGFFKTGAQAAIGAAPAIAGRVTLPTRMALAGAGMAIGEDSEHTGGRALIDRAGNFLLGAGTEFGFEMGGRLVVGGFRQHVWPALVNIMRPAGRIRPGNAQAALRDALDRTHAAIRTQDARYAAAAEEHSRAMAAIAEDANGVQPGAGGAAMANNGVRAGDPAGASPGVSAGDGAPGAASAADQAPEALALTEDVGPGTRHNDGVGPEGSSSPRPGGEDAAASPAEDEGAYALIVDGNAILARAGITEQVIPGTPLTPDGRIPVSSTTKAALDQLGWGRAFADVDARIPPHTILVDTAEDGTERVVGRFATEDLDRLVEDVQAYVDETGDPFTERGRVLQGDAAIDLPAGSSHGQWTMTPLGATYEVPAILRAIVDRIGTLARPMSDDALMANAQATADALGMDGPELVQFAAHLTGGNAELLPTAIVALRTVWKRMGEEVDFHAVNWMSAPTAANEVAARQAIHNVMTATAAMEDVKTAMGRGMRALGLPDADTYLSQTLKDAAEEAPVPTPANVAPSPPPLPKTAEDLRNWIRMWQASVDNPAAREAMLQGLTWAPEKWHYLRSSFANHFTAAIISGPRTIALNVIAPAVISMGRGLERIGGGYIAAMNPLSGANAAARMEAIAVANDTPRAFIGAMADIGDAFRIAFSKYRSEAPSDLWDGYNPIGQVYGVSGDVGRNPLDFSSRGIPPALIEAATRADPGLTGDGAYWLGNVINTFPQWMHALHGSTNEFAQRLAYAGEVRAQGMLAARQAGLKGRQAADFLRTFVRDNTDDITGYGRNQAARESTERTTMLRSMTGNETQPNVGAVMGTLQRIRSAIPESRYILPILTVPANALGETLRRIPGASFTPFFKETTEELAGTHGTIRMAEAYGRQLMGASLLLWGALAARSGLITGAGPKDPNDRRLWSETHRPYSIRLGDQWVGYDRIDLVGPLVAIAATWNDNSVHRGTDGQQSALMAVAALGEFFRDRAALQGVADLMSIGADPQSVSTMQRMMQRTAAGFIPNFITQIGRRNADPFARTVHAPTGMEGSVSGTAIGVMDAILNALPGGSTELDPMRNVLGEEVMASQTAAFNLLPISLAPQNTYQRDAILDELGRSYEVTGYAPGVPAPVAGRFDMREVDLEDGRSLYDAVVRYRTVVRDEEGRTLREALQVLFNSPEYNEAQDASASRSQDDEETSSRQYLTRRVFTQFNQLARQEVARTSPIAARWLAIGDAQQVNPSRLNAYGARQLATEPGLLESLGIPIDRHIAHVRGDDQ